MSDQTVLPYQREGLWLSSHGYYYRCAYNCLDQYLALRASICSQEEALYGSPEVEALPPEDRWSYVSWKTCKINDTADQLRISSILFACMALESFINHYGVRRLGENYFHRNLERIGITEKFSLVALVCHGLLIDTDDAALKALRSMFDIRNKLVHPKTRELNLERLKRPGGNPNEGEEISAIFGSLEMVIDKMCALDEHILRDFEFKKATA